MSKNKEKDTTVWKPKGGQKIMQSSGPALRRRKVFKSEHRADRSSGIIADLSGSKKPGRSAGYDAPSTGGSEKPGRSAGYDAPSTGLGKLSLLIGAGAIIAALAKGVKNSDYYKDKD